MEVNDEFDRETSQKNYEQFLKEQWWKKPILHRMIEDIRLNEYGLDIGQINQLLRALCVHYPTLDDFLMAACAAWIDMHRKQLEEGK